MQIEKDQMSMSKLIRWSVFLLIFSVIVCIGNYIGNEPFRAYPIWEPFIGMVILCIITLIGMILERVIPYNVSSIVYISILGLVLALPGVPTADFIVYYVSQIDLTVICTVFLGYVGIGIGKDWDKFKKIGWRGVLITMCVIIGTYVGSAVIANIVLALTGSI